MLLLTVTDDEISEIDPAGAHCGPFAATCGGSKTSTARLTDTLAKTFIPLAEVKRLLLVTLLPLSSMDGGL